jgi:hypothetical protein
MFLFHYPSAGEPNAQIHLHGASSCDRLVIDFCERCLLPQNGTAS